MHARSSLRKEIDPSGDDVRTIRGHVPEQLREGVRVDYDVSVNQDKNVTIGGSGTGLQGAELPWLESPNPSQVWVSHRRVRVHG